MVRVRGRIVRLRENRKQGAGIRVGSKVARSGRRRHETQAKGDLTVELTSKGLGTLLQTCFGTGVSTLVSGSTYQQNFTLGTGATPPSMTVQKGLVRADGTVDPYTYNGGVVDSFEIDCPQGDIAKLKASFVPRHAYRHRVRGTVLRHGRRCFISRRALSPSAAPSPHRPPRRLPPAVLLWRTCATSTSRWITS